MTKIIDINEHRKPRLSIVKNDEDREYDQLMAAMHSAMHCASASRNWSQHKKAWLLNCRDALDRASFLLDDEIDQVLGRDRDDQD